MRLYTPITHCASQARAVSSFMSVRFVATECGHELRELIMFPVAHFPDGQIRPVFSSAQLEFIQQWLFAMGLTKEPIPLPSSEFLIRKEDMTICSPQLFNSADKLKGMIKVCIKFGLTCETQGADLQSTEKNNKRIRGSADSLLVARRHRFERVRTLWADKVGTWIAIDTEEWERDHTVVTELGWSRVQWRDGEILEDQAHWIVQENQYYRNGTYVTDRRNVSRMLLLRFRVGDTDVARTTTLARARC